LFLPQLFGPDGEAPTYAQRQAAHRARFTEDNQPAEGVERVNPDYPPPPATPAQITAIQNEILNLLAARALVEQEAEHQSERADHCEANQDPIQQTVDDTTAGISAVQAHNEAIARREAVNQEQQQRQQEVQGLTAGYPSRATGLAALTYPLAAWEGFTSLASHLPGAAGDKMLQMNREAQEMQAAFAQMGAEMLGVDSAGPAREAELQSDQERLETTDAQAQTSEQELNTASEGAAGLQEANEATLAEASQARDTATDQAQQLGEAATQREEQATSLAEQLRVWAEAHKAARDQAIEATVSRLQSEGYTIIGSRES
jgi:DNA repair exonuclease SbcCD ATPase subunit